MWPRSPLIDLVDSIGNEATVSGMKAKWIDRRQLMACRQVDNQISSGYGMRCHNHPTLRHEGKLRNAALDFLGVVHTERSNPYVQSHRSGFCGLQKSGMGGCFRMQKDRYACHRGCNFFKRLQPFYS